MNFFMGNTAKHPTVLLAGVRTMLAESGDHMHIRMRSKGGVEMLRDLAHPTVGSCQIRRQQEDPIGFRTYPRTSLFNELLARFPNLCG